MIRYRCQPYQVVGDHLLVAALGGDAEPLTEHLTARRLFSLFQYHT